eukprot:TRINITY_DN10654_c0_g1_i1.p3 TRINITY_DN10654_c0_g1~~TRINITY_DN10654_c0_g1_i1.p3  ORF type:complete len:74 (+),score=19.71 TRINITY_DN10654_c0_g1_i1:699-920(+)
MSILDSKSWFLVYRLLWPDGIEVEKEVFLSEIFNGLTAFLQNSPVGLFESRLNSLGAFENHGRSSETAKAHRG